ncbi:MAG: alpha/beta hydrolase [Burkholderiaceae bacterium]
MLNPQAKALLDLISSLGFEPMNELPVEEARKNYRDRRHGTQPEAPPIGAVVDHQVPVAGGTITVREYRPGGAAQASARLPALVYFHGGGWTIGDLDTHDTLCRSLCAGAECAIYAVDYRMGPEFKFPTAVEDAQAAFQWVLTESDRLRVDPTRVAVGGDSAGGNLAAVVSLQTRDQGSPAPVYQLLIYPAVDQRAGHDSHERNGEGYLLTQILMRWFREQYHAHPDEYLDWRASPLLAESFAGLPPALVLTAEYDPLVDEGQAYAAAMDSAGVPVEAVMFPGQVHGFITMGKVLDDANTAVKLCAARLKTVFNG